ncbi:MAG TPA: cation transporter [Candidatus Acidoferrales bacterium]|nr:cation transporter [Candidatus Acidoferrales bacterium]
MKTIKLISGLLTLAAFLSISVFQSNSFAKNKPTAKTEHINLRVSGMMCSSCSKSLESSLCKFKGAKNVKANYNTGYASLDVPATTQVTRDQLVKAVADAGFTLKEVKFTPKTQKALDLKQQ